MNVVFRGGRLPNDPSKPRLRLSPHLDLSAPVAPPVSDWMSKVTQWPMYDNDRYGCCLVEGTSVQADGVQSGQRVHYEGPVIELVFATGKRLTVTPNHAVLTPRGFIRARFLKKGDYAVGARGGKLTAISPHLDHAPTAVEEVLTTAMSSGAESRRYARVRSTQANDFHGDGRFMDGDVDVVDINGLLQRELDTTLSEPDSKDQLGSTRATQRLLSCYGSKRQRSMTRRHASLRDVSDFSESGTLISRHGRVDLTQGFGLRSNGVTSLDEQLLESMLIDPGFTGQLVERLSGAVALKERRQVRHRGTESSLVGLPDTLAAGSFVASDVHPSHDGGATDVELATDLLSRQSGLVQTDYLIDINVRWYRGHVYDLSTERRWYVANGILTHNCVWAAIGHQIQALSAYGLGTVITVTDNDVLLGYEQVTGFKPSDPSTDQGTVVQDALNYWRKTGIAGHKIFAFAQVNHRNRAECEAAANIFGNLHVGINFPASAMDQFNAGQNWDAVAHDGGIDGGHAIMVGAYVDATKLWDPVTWAKRIHITQAFWDKYVDEAWVVVAPEWLNASGISPTGVNLTGLGQDFSDLTGEPNPFPAPTPTPSPTPTPPTPTPPPPTPVPPAPTPTPGPITDLVADQKFAAVLKPWVMKRHVLDNNTIANAAKTWLSDRNL